jgi:hypothetical protein
MALLTDDRRSATVFAIRDSESQVRSTFEFARRHPAFLHIAELNITVCAGPGTTRRSDALVVGPRHVG